MNGKAPLFESKTFVLGMDGRTDNDYSLVVVTLPATEAPGRSRSVTVTNEGSL